MISYTFNTLRVDLLHLLNANFPFQNLCVVYWEITLLLHFSVLVPCLDVLWEFLQVAGDFGIS